MTAAIMEMNVLIPSGNETLEGTLALPSRPRALVIFAHGSGSSGRSPRNARVSAVLQTAGFGTLLFDLLTPKEQEKYRENVYDIGLLTRRLADAVAWAKSDPRTAGLRIALIGSSTGAAAALNVAASMGAAVSAAVSRGGRPDLADPDRLPPVTAPTR